MTEPEAWTLAGKVTAAALIIGTLILFAYLSITRSEPQPDIPLVNASACDKPVNPCDLLECKHNWPRGLLDPDAGEWDQRRIS